VTVSNSSASAADDAGDGKLDNTDALSMATAAAAEAAAGASAEPESDNELLISGADCSRRPVTTTFKRVYSSPRQPISELQSVTCHMGSHRRT